MKQHPQRIAPMDHPYGAAAETLSKAALTSVDGAPLNILRTLAHHPGLLRRYMAFGGEFMVRGLLDERIREIVVLRTAWLSRSEYEWGQHVVIARRLGLTNSEISLLGSESPHDDC